MKPTLVVLALLLFAGISKADTVYDYVGAPFTSTSGIVCSTPSCNVTGQLVLAQPLASNTITTFAIGVNPPSSFTFSSFGLTINSSSTLIDPSLVGSFIQLGTDAAGKIDEYNVQIFSLSPIRTNLVSVNNGSYLYDSFGTWSSFLGYTGTAGTWTEEKAISTPEPSSLLLLGSGLGLLALLSKKTLSA